MSGRVRPQSGKDWYSEALSGLFNKPHQTEADVSDRLIRPCLERVLGFSPASIDAQPSAQIEGGRGLRPDYICRANDAAALFVEVKNLGTDLDRRQSAQSAYATSPMGQLELYLQKYPEAGPRAVGVLTNGTNWRILRRHGQDVELCESFDATTLRDVQAALVRVTQLVQESAQTAIQPLPKRPRWLEALDSSLLTPNWFLGQIEAVGEITPVRTHSAYACTTTLQCPDKLLDSKILVACFEFDFPDGLFSPPDIANRIDEIIRIRKRRDDIYRIFGAAYTDGRGGGRTAMSRIRLGRRQSGRNRRSPTGSSRIARCSAIRCLGGRGRESE